MSVLGELWDRVSGTQPAPPVWIIAVTGIVALGIVLNTRTWHVARNAITIAHEGGHALISVLTGRKLEGIRLHADTSGVTYSRGRGSGIGITLTTAAGYITPPLLGALAAWLLAAHHITSELWLLLVLLAATFLAIRNAYGALAVLLTAAAVCAVTLLTRAAVQAVFSYGTAWFLLLGGVRPVFELYRERSRSYRRDRAGRTDADQLARLTGVPGGVWVFAFGLVAVAALILGACLLAPIVQHIHPGLPPGNDPAIPVGLCLVHGALQGFDVALAGVARAADRVDAGALRGQCLAGQLGERVRVDLLALGAVVGVLQDLHRGDLLPRQRQLDLHRAVQGIVRRPDDGALLRARGRLGRA
jgi:hypothetical protein